MRFIKHTSPGMTRTQTQLHSPPPPSHPFLASSPPHIPYFTCTRTSHWTRFPAIAFLPLQTQPAQTNTSRRPWPSPPPPPAQYTPSHRSTGWRHSGQGAPTGTAPQQPRHTQRCTESPCRKPTCACGTTAAAVRRLPQSGRRHGTGPQAEQLSAPPQLRYGAPRFGTHAPVPYVHARRKADRSRLPHTPTPASPPSAR